MIVASRNPPIMQDLVAVPRGLAKIGSPLYHEPLTQLLQHHNVWVAHEGMACLMGQLTAAHLNCSSGFEFSVPDALNEINA